jgi:GNAT superfamily N-acetyltransferase
MSAITIRKAEARDLPVVFDLVERLLRELGEEGDELGALDVEGVRRLWLAQGERTFALLAESPSGRPAGVATLVEAFAVYANGFYGMINEMYVVPEYRSAGVGARLIAEAAAEGRRRGWRRLDVTAPESERWLRTRRFYENQGFVFTGPKLKLAL